MAGPARRSWASRLFPARATCRSIPFCDRYRRACCRLSAPLTNSAAFMVVVSVSRPGLPERDLALVPEPSSVKRTVAGLMPGVILTVTESTKSPGLGETSMSGLPSACASQLAAISDVPASRSCTSGLTAAGSSARLSRRASHAARRTAPRSSFSNARSSSGVAISRSACHAAYCVTRSFPSRADRTVAGRAGAGGPERRPAPRQNAPEAQRPAAPRRRRRAVGRSGGAPGCGGRRSGSPGSSR